MVNKERPNLEVLPNLSDVTVDDIYDLIKGIYPSIDFGENTIVAVRGTTRELATTEPIDLELIFEKQTRKHLGTERTIMTLVCYKEPDKPVVIELNCEPAEGRAQKLVLDQTEPTDDDGETILFSSMVTISDVHNWLRNFKQEEGRLLRAVDE